MMFSTLDNDNDICAGYSCAVGDGGAWWFACCTASNLNYDSASYWTTDTPTTYDVPVSRMLVQII